MVAAATIAAMPASAFDWVLLALLAVLLLLTLWLATRRPDDEAARGASERPERGPRDEGARSAAGTRQELGQSLASFQRTLLTQQGDVARTQNEQIDSFRTQLAA